MEAFHKTVINDIRQTKYDNYFADFQKTWKLIALVWNLIESFHKAYCLFFFVNTMIYMMILNAKDCALDFLNFNQIRRKGSKNTTDEYNFINNSPPFVPLSEFSFIFMYGKVNEVFREIGVLSLILSCFYLGYICPHCMLRICRTPAKRMKLNSIFLINCMIFLTLRL